MNVVVEAISGEAFAPFGTVVRAPSNVGRIAFPNTLANLRISAEATLSTSRALPQILPVTSSVMERHRFSSQTFFPLDVARYVIVVAPQGLAGMPEMSRALAFVVQGDTAITYGADCWHHPMIALDRPACFSVLLWRDGSSADIETVRLDRPFQIVEG